MDEKLDLEPERQREIDALDEKLNSGNLFDVLGVPAGASVDDVRNAFREASRRFHPDRFFGKNLGSFRPKLDRIFKKLVEANQTLSDPERRQAYLDANPFVRAAIKAAGGASSEVKREQTADEKARDDERRARLARHPYLMKTSKVQESLARARDAISKKEFSQAFTHLNLAAQADPQNSDVKTLLAEVRRQNDVQRAETNFKHATEALNRGDTALALQALKIAANSGHVVAAYKSAILLENSGADLREATSYAQKAVEGDPKSAEYRVLLGRLLEQAGMKAMAKKHFEEAQRLDPENPEVKKYVKKRWPF